MNGSLQLVLVQAESPPQQAWSNDASRPNSLRLIRKLLSLDEGRYLSHLVPNHAPAVVVFPELAFGSTDWDEIDGLVREYPAPLILFAGFGVTAGATLRQWITTNGPTSRVAAWEHLPETARRYQCGWSWIHVPNAQTQCATFLKTSLEQRHEEVLADLAKGTENICVRTADLALFAGICADWLDQQEGRYVLVEKIRAELAKNGPDQRAILLVGMLLQDKIHNAWGSAIQNAAHQINMLRVNVCISNCASTFLAYDEAVDRWRNYTGVYIARQVERTPLEIGFEAVRSLPDDHLVGAVSRTNAPCAISGELRWVFPQTGRHVWAARTSITIRANGQVQHGIRSGQLEFEFTRFLRRLMSAGDAPEIAKKTCSVEAMGRVVHQVETGNTPNAEQIARSMLFGTRESEGQWQDIKVDKLWESRDPIAIGARALGALAGCPHVSWSTNGASIGQLKLDGKLEILVWSSSERPTAARQKQMRLRSSTIPADPLLVFCRWGGEPIAEANVTPRRDDISSLPASHSRMADAPRPNNLVKIVLLDEVDACFDEPNEQCHVRVAELLDSGSRALQDEVAAQ